AGAPAWQAAIDPGDARFLNPPSMLDAIRSFCVETGQAPPADAGALARCALESLALSYRQVKDELECLLGRPLCRIRVGGGGGHNGLLNQLTADACELPLEVGPPESSLLGNACAQLLGLGALGSLDEARAILRRSYEAREIEPRGIVPDEARARFTRVARDRSRPNAAPPRAPQGAKVVTS
ncbi:MAG TPA: FGGY-family carbohydrate kinase, partial [Polyangiaceae bacterium]|nr:FGGY-family carbohydrate kinase [Polyangiaceae bacterium]